MLLSQGQAHVEVDHPRVVAATMYTGAAAVMGAAVLTIEALPAIGRHLQASQTQLQWTVDITPTVLAALVLLSGAALDRYGRRRGLILGMTVMLVSLLWSGVVGSANELLAARFMTGLGAAMMFPGTLATITAVTPTERRARAVGMWAGSTMIGGTAGLLIAGAMLELPLWWGSFFVAAALIVAVLLIATVLTVPETRDPGAPRLDFGGGILSFLAVGGIVLGITELPVRSLADPIVLGGFVLAAVAIPAFIGWELRAPHPMLDVRLFRNRMFAGGAASVCLLFVGCYGWFFLSFQYFAYVLDYNPLEGGLGLIPNAIATVPCAVMGARWAYRYGWRPIVVFSLVVLAIGSALMAIVGGQRSFWLIAVAFFVFGIGLGSGQAAPTQAIVDALPASKQGVASAVNDAARELGAAVGIAIMGSAFNFAYRSRISGVLDGMPAQVLHAARSSPAAGQEVASRLPAHAGAERVAHAISTAAIAGWGAAFWVATALFIFSAAAIHFAARERRAGAPKAVATGGAAPAPAYASAAGAVLTAVLLVRLVRR